jgi:hypothetical protein
VALLSFHKLKKQHFQFQLSSFIILFFPTPQKWQQYQATTYSPLSLALTHQQLPESIQVLEESATTQG